jgi:hypothetical protein
MSPRFQCYLCSLLNQRPLKAKLFIAKALSFRLKLEVSTEDEISEDEALTLSAASVAPVSTVVKQSEALDCTVLKTSDASSNAIILNSTLALMNLKLPKENYPNAKNR